jgi:hypothetical protein
MGIVDELISPGGGIATLLDDVVKRVWQDPAQAQQAKNQMLLAMAELQQKGELAEFNGRLQQAIAQANVEAEEAKNPSIFIAGARAFIEWVCGFGLAYQLVARPLFVWASTSWLHVPAPPSLELQALASLITMMLGIGSLQVTHSVLSK